MEIFTLLFKTFSRAVNFAVPSKFANITTYTVTVIALIPSLVSEALSHGGASSHSCKWKGATSQEATDTQSMHSYKMADSSVTQRERDSVLYGEETAE